MEKTFVKSVYEQKKWFWENKKQSCQDCWIRAKKSGKYRRITSSFL